MEPRREWSRIVKCAQSGCAGKIEDGYCNLCGMAPRKSPAAAGRPSTPPPNAPLASAPIGSAPIGSASVSGTSSSGTRTSNRTTRSTSTRASSGTARIGAGLVTVEPVPEIDPSTVVLANAEVSEDKRFCAKCAKPVGRSRDDSPGRTQGFCSGCGSRFDFDPTLRAGELVGGQYEVVGALAHGGLGWIYLGRDRNVSDRWVVLKGLLNAGDSEAMEAAVAERRFLAQVKHPNIVEIYNFVQHLGNGYTVMEYVGGKSLKTILKERATTNGGRMSPLPPAEAIAYLLGILPAFSYLHSQGLIYCDFKPDNIIQEGGDLKLIDLGGVRRADDNESAIYGTVGFQAPEVAELGTSVPSDTYTIARTLAVLILDFKGYQSTFANSLPDTADHPVLTTYPSLYRLLVRGTASDPQARFQTADELAAQLLGVLREIVAHDDGQQHPAQSTLFGADRSMLLDIDGVPKADWRSLPMLRNDPNDPSTPFLLQADVSDASQLVRFINDSLRLGAVGDTSETKLRLARAMLDAGDTAGTHGQANLALTSDPWDWRGHWFHGLCALAENRPVDAVVSFDRVYAELPGESSPKVALALAYELSNRIDLALPLYELVATADRGQSAAVFGLARCRHASGDRVGAVEAYDRVPSSSALRRQAQLALAQSLIQNTGGTATPPSVADLTTAASRLDTLHLSPTEQARHGSGLLEVALSALKAKTVAPTADVKLFGCALNEREVRGGLERFYRELARTSVGDAKISLIDKANAVRPRTLV
jgi:serine/threonine-protein kinase PknG